MLKSFNSLLIQKFVNFFWDDGLVQEFFSYAYALAGYFCFQNHPPPPPKVKWLASNG